MTAAFVTARAVVGGVALVALLGLTACGEKTQASVQGGTKKLDAQASSGATVNGYTAPGWKAGDNADWQRQMTQRAQAQNEYVRIGTQKPAP
jgi:major membrane immunogen (membrane-anchored lipoprotein)